VVSSSGHQIWQSHGVGGFWGSGFGTICMRERERERPCGES
jgi:hypothetical protein